MADPGPPAAITEDRLMRALAGLAGLAPSTVLRARLRRAAALHHALPEHAGTGDQAGIDHPGWAALLDAVTVQETCFFRHPTQWAALREAVLPRLLPRAQAEGRPLRLFSAGCATGEEAWSLAALGLAATETWATHGAPPVAVRVTGLDLSRPALRAAALAHYRGPPDPLREMPAAYHRFMETVRLDNGVVVRPGAALRQRVSFSRANLLDLAPPAEGQDIILCRNVLVYLTEPARRQVVARLAAALRPGGALVLGPLDRPPGGIGLLPWSAAMIGFYRREGGDD